MTGLNPYDLELPPRMPQPGDVFECRVCGKPRTVERYEPLRALLPGAHRVTGRTPPRRPHDDCDRDVERWQRQFADLDCDPDYRAAMEVVYAAQEAAEQAWAGKARALGLRDWITEQEIENHANRGCGC